MGYIETYFGSFVLYSVVICFCTLLAKWAKSRNYNLRIIWLLIIILTFFEGLRGESVVIDTYNYYNVLIYPLICGSTPNPAFETGFVCFAKLVLFISNNSPKAFFITVALIINSLIILRLLDFKDQIDFPYYVFVFLVMYMIQTMNVMAQWIAVSIIFYFSRYLKKDTWWIFLIASYIAFEIHNSSVIAIMIFLVFYLFDKTFYHGIRKGFLLIPIILICIYLVSYAYTYMLYGKYYYLIESASSNVGLFIPAKFLLILVVIVCMMKRQNKLNYSENWKVHNYLTILSILSILSLALTFLGYYFIWVGRIGYMFVLWELLLISVRANNQVGLKFAKTSYALLMLYSYILLMITNSTGQLPYLF